MKSAASRSWESQRVQAQAITNARCTKVRATLMPAADVCLDDHCYDA